MIIPNETTSSPACAENEFKKIKKIERSQSKPWYNKSAHSTPQVQIRLGQRLPFSPPTLRFDPSTSSNNRCNRQSPDLSFLGSVSCEPDPEIYLCASSNAAVGSRPHLDSTFFQGRKFKREARRNTEELNRSMRKKKQNMSVRKRSIANGNRRIETASAIAGEETGLSPR